MVVDDELYPSRGFRSRGSGVSHCNTHQCLNLPPVPLVVEKVEEEGLPLEEGCVLGGTPCMEVR